MLDHPLQLVPIESEWLGIGIVELKLPHHTSWPGASLDRCCRLLCKEKKLSQLF